MKKETVVIFDTREGVDGLHSGHFCDGCGILFTGHQRSQWEVIDLGVGVAIMCPKCSDKTTEEEKDES